MEIVGLRRSADVLKETIAQLDLELMKPTAFPVEAGSGSKAIIRSQARLSTRWVAGLIMALLGTAWWLQPALSENGLQAVYSSGLSRVERAAFITANDGTYGGQSLHIVWTGYVYQPTAGDVAFRLPTGAQARLLLDDQLVFERTPTDRAPDVPATVHLTTGLHPLRFEVTTPENFREYFRAGLEWNTALGWRLVPATQLYPRLPDITFAQDMIQRSSWSRWLSGIALYLAIVWCFFKVWSYRDRLKTRTGLGLVVCVALALIVRLIIFQALVTRPHYEVLPVGHDQRAYQGYAQDMLRGYWPNGPFDIQPGLSLTLGAAYTLGGLDLSVLPFWQTVMGALATLLVYDIARRVFNPAAGWLAAGLWVIFPLPIFYEAQLVTHGLEVQLSTWILWLWLRALDSPRASRLIALGVTIGAASIVRPTLLPVAAAVVVSLVGWRLTQWRQAIKPGLTLISAVLLPIAPITWHNYQTGGHFQLINGHTDATLYLGNNRDANGLALASPAYFSTANLVRAGQITYLQQTVDDIRANPLRWLQLMARKIMLYLGDPEIPNNVDFYREGVAVSPLLAALPLRFGAMLALALSGVIIAWRRGPRTPGLWALVAFIVIQLLVTIVHSSFSRLRAPIYPALVALAAGAVMAIIQQVRDGHQRHVAQSAAILISAGLFVGVMPFVADHVMSPPLVATLPIGIHQLNAPLGESLRLVGYDYEPLPRSPGDSLVVTFYWQSQAPRASDIHLTIELLSADGQAIGDAQFLGFIGTGSFPKYPTSQWRPGEVIRDPFAITLPTGAAVPAALRIFVAELGREDYVAVGPLPLSPAQALRLPSDAQPIGATIGRARLAAYRAAVIDDTLTLTLYWEAVSPSVEDGIAFVHLLDANGQLVLGQDQRPVNGLHSTQAWQPGEGIVDEHQLRLPSEGTPGRYRLEVGMYDVQTQARFPVTLADGEPAPDNALTLTEIQPPALRAGPSQ